MCNDCSWRLPKGRPTLGPFRYLTRDRRNGPMCFSRLGPVGWSGGLLRNFIIAPSLPFHVTRHLSHPRLLRRPFWIR